MMSEQLNGKANRDAVAAAIVATVTFFTGLALLVDWAARLSIGL